MVAQAAAAVVEYVPSLCVFVEPMFVQPWKWPLAPRLWICTVRLACTGVVAPVR